MQRWSRFLIYGWATLTFSLFLAIVAGKTAARIFPSWSNAENIIQALTMSFLVVPITLYLYKKLFGNTNKAEKTAFAYFPHIVTGFLFPVGLAVIALGMMHLLGWITLEGWPSLWSWLGALATNFSIALLYEALPEEIVMRGLIYDTLRQKLSIWVSVLMQAVIFLAFSAGITLLLVSTGLSSTASLAALPAELLLHFFFAIALALLRVWTGSIWTSIGFHLSFLMMSRFLLMPDAGGNPVIVHFQDHIAPGFAASISIMTIILGTIGILLFLLLVQRFQNKLSSNI